MNKAFQKDDLDINDLSQYLAITILTLCVIGQSFIIGQQNQDIQNNQHKIDAVYTVLDSENNTEKRTHSANNTDRLDNYTGPTIEVSSPTIEFGTDNEEPDYMNGDKDWEYEKTVEVLAQ